MPEDRPHFTPEGLSLNNERDEIQRILGNPPAWSLRWGITAVLVAAVAFLCLAWLIRYPDVAKARVVVVTENPPVRLVARSSGKVSRLMVTDQQPVEVGQLIAELENPALLEDVSRLEEFVRRMEGITEPSNLLDLQTPEGLRLGELQGSYARLQQLLKDLQFFERQQGTLARIASLSRQIQYLEGLNTSLEKQATTLAREVEIAKESFNRNNSLLHSGAISQLELEEAETNYLQYRRQLESLQSRVVDNKLQAEQFRSQIIALRQGRSSESMERWLAVREALEQLKSQLEQWKHTYLITSPAAGRISLSRIWREQQFVQANEEVATVVPGEGSGKVVGRALLPTVNSGKVQKGMRANIRLEGYPYQEFGVLQGQVSSIALVPEQEAYLVEIALSDSLVTSYGRTIPFAQELPGTARIITEDRRILDRVFDQVLSLVKNN